MKLEHSKQLKEFCAKSVGANPETIMVENIITSATFGDLPVITVDFLYFKNDTDLFPCSSELTFDLVFNKELTKP